MSSTSEKTDSKPCEKVTKSLSISVKTDIKPFGEIPRKLVIAEVASGEIRIESGADGTYLLFDCECIDALPFCRAQCCALKGTMISPEEYDQGKYWAEWSDELQGMVLRRDADGKCCYLDRGTCTCEIYSDRPNVCQQFHCTRGGDVRGWKLSNSVHRHSNR